VAEKAVEMSDASGAAAHLEQRIAVIAAAGRGTRFAHTLPKVLAEVGGRPCLQRVIDAVEGGLGEHRQLIVVGGAADQIREAVGEAPHRRYVVQQQARGTGDALRCALASLTDLDHGSVYFFCGDKPLLRPETVTEFRRRFETDQPPMLFLTGSIEGDDQAVMANRQGRVVTVVHNGRPHAMAIVERSAIDSLHGLSRFALCNGAVHAFSRDQLLGIRDVNVSTYAWSLAELRRMVGLLTDDNPQGEVLVTDLVHLYQQHGLAVQTMALGDPHEGRGIDTVPQWQEIRHG
jgi:bifunctional UDP-N-acetylglucosamine pyrophosphorylase/glucosamine-1-phosphate N-acetyltransferase